MERPRNRHGFSRLLPASAIVSLVLGLAVGSILRPLSPHGWVGHWVEMFDVVGAMWVDAIRMTVIPLIFPLLVGSIAGAANGRSAARLSLVTVAAFLGLVCLLAVTAALSAPLLFSGLHVDPAITAQLRTSHDAISLPSGDTSLARWFRTLIPTNPIKALADGEMLSIVLFAVAFGFATLAAPPDLRLRTVRFAQGLSTIMLIMVQTVLLFAPIGVFALSLVIGVKVGSIAFAALGYFLAVELVLVSLCIISLFGLALARSGLTLARIVIGAAPALMVAAGTSSSLSALPAMIEGARDIWRLPEPVYGFVLPFSVATFKPTSAFSWVMAAYFVATIYKIPFDGTSLAATAGYTILCNATVPGIPGGGIIVASAMFSTLGLPLEGLAIILAVNPILDRFVTIGNVAADMAIAAIIAGRPKD